MNARIKAAADAIRHYTGGNVSVKARQIAEDALAAADEAEAPLVERLYDALQLAAGLRHDMDNHRKPYRDCEVVGCVSERVVLAAFWRRQAH